MAGNEQERAGKAEADEAPITVDHKELRILCFEYLRRQVESITLRPEHALEMYDAMMSATLSKLKTTDMNEVENDITTRKRLVEPSLKKALDGSQDVAFHQEQFFKKAIKDAKEYVELLERLNESGYVYSCPPRTRPFAPSSAATSQDGATSSATLTPHQRLVLATIARDPPSTPDAPRSVRGPFTDMQTLRAYWAARNKKESELVEHPTDIIQNLHLSKRKSDSTSGWVIQREWESQRQEQPILGPKDSEASAAITQDLRENEQEPDSTSGVNPDEPQILSTYTGPSWVETAESIGHRRLQDKGRRLD